MSKQVVKTLIIVYKIYLQYVANNLLINFVLWAFRADGSKHNLFIFHNTRKPKSTDKVGPKSKGYCYLAY